MGLNRTSVSGNVSVSFCRKILTLVFYWLLVKVKSLVTILKVMFHKIKMLGFVFLSGKY